MFIFLAFAEEFQDVTEEFTKTKLEILKMRQDMKQMKSIFQTLSGGKVKGGNTVTSKYLFQPVFTGDIESTIISSLPLCDLESVFKFEQSLINLDPTEEFLLVSYN